MSKIILCTSKQAKTPFVFLNTKVEIYTYEELCFYIFNNTVLISKTTLSDKLVSWIREELGMDALADRLAGLLNKSVSAQDILIEILTAGDYYSADEIHDYSAAWQKYRKFSPDLRPCMSRAKGRCGSKQPPRLHVITLQPLRTE